MMLVTQRLLAAGCTAAFIAVCRDQTAYLTGVFAMGMAHYTASFLYSGGSMQRLATPRTILPLVLLLVIGGAVTVIGWDHNFKLILYFALHHVFNEVYLGRSAIGLKEGPEAVRFRLASGFFHACIYLALLVNEDYMAWSGSGFTPALMWPLLAFATLGLGYAILRAWPSLSARGLAEACIFEGVLLVMAVASLTGKLYVGYLDIVLYHFVLWVFYPLTKLKRRPEALRYVGVLTGLVALFAFGFGPVPLGIFPHWVLFFLASYLHITSAFALSTAFPSWITNWFQQPIAAPRVAVLQAGPATIKRSPTSY